MIFAHQDISKSGLASYVSVNPKWLVQPFTTPPHVLMIPFLPFSSHIFHTTWTFLVCLAMSSESDAFARSAMPENDERTSISMRESGCQPTAETGVGAYNTSYWPWDMPGAAFDVELDALDVCSQNEQSTETLSRDVWSDWINIPSAAEVPWHSFQPIVDLKEVSGLISGTNSGLQVPDLVEPSALSFGGFPPSSEASILEDNPWTARSIIDDASNAEETSKLGYVTNTALVAPAEGSTTSQLWPPRASSPFLFELPSWEGSWPNALLEAGDPANMQQDQRVDDADARYHRLRTPSGLQSTTRIQGPRMRQRENLPQCHAPLPATLIPPTSHQELVQGSLQHNDASRHQRLETNNGDLITIQNHTITDELPWKRGAKLPMVASRCTFHTFSVGGNPIKQKTRKSFSKQRLKEMNEVRRQKACLRCRHDKVRVSIFLSSPWKVDLSTVSC